MKSRNLNFLEPSGPLQACKGTASPYLLTIRDQVMAYRPDVAEGSPAAYRRQQGGPRMTVSSMTPFECLKVRDLRNVILYLRIQPCIVTDKME